MDAIPRVEKRPDMIESPKNASWEMFLTGAEGYVGRDCIESGGIYSTEGQPYKLSRKNFRNTCL